MQTVQPALVGNASKKSPPTSLSSPAGRYRVAVRSPGTGGSSGGRRPACSSRMISARSAASRALRTAMPARWPSSSASHRSSPVNRRSRPSESVPSWAPPASSATTIRSSRADRLAPGAGCRSVRDVDHAPLGELGTTTAATPPRVRSTVRRGRQHPGRLRQQALADLGTLDLRHVLDDVDDPVDATVGVAQDAHLVQQPALLAGRDRRRCARAWARGAPRPRSRGRRGGRGSRTGRRPRRRWKSAP